MRTPRDVSISSLWATPRAREMIDLSAIADLMEADIAVPTGAVIVIEALDADGDMALYTVAAPDDLLHWRIVGMLSWAIERAKTMGAEDE